MTSPNVWLWEILPPSKTIQKFYLKSNIHLVLNYGVGLGEEEETEDEMVGWQHRLDGYEFEQTPGNSGGQASLVCSSPWAPKESNRME